MLVAYADRLPKWSAPQQYGRPKRFILAILAGSFVLSWFLFYHESIPRFSLSQWSKNPINNSTLGFQKVYALGLPGREDRLLPLLDAANATNVTLTVLNAVKDSEIEHIDYPTKWHPEDHQPGELGCLASHVRTWNLMIADNVTSALILESDADWDLRIRTSLASLATGVRTLIDWPFTTAHHTLSSHTHPYGDSWDILWIGHCGSNRDGNVRAYAWNDTSAPPKDKEFWFAGALKDEQYTPGTRSVFQFGETVCSTGYAISQQGARKLAAYFKDAEKNLDLQLSDLCSKKADMTCLSVWPQLITSAGTPSNIEHPGGEIAQKNSNHHGEKVVAGLAIQYSARVNAKRILDSGFGYVPMTKWMAEWDTTWAINPYHNDEWEVLKLNKTTGEPIFFEPGKDAGAVLGELEVEKSNSRVRRAMLADPY